MVGIQGILLFRFLPTFLTPLPVQEEKSGVELPWFPALAALAGLLLCAVFAVNALRSARGPRVRPPRPAPLVKVAPPPPPPPVAPLYKKAPVHVGFPSIRPDYPDVWGQGELLEVEFRVEDAAWANQPLTVHVAGEPVVVQLRGGTGLLRRTFPTTGEREIRVEVKAKNENLPRRTSRVIKIVDYRLEIAEVFANFREEASRAITPIREDATPWEIYDLLTEANPKLPGDRLREIVGCFEEAKFSNHSVTRATYERMINALLQLERVEL